MSTITDERWRVDIGLGRNLAGTDWRHEWTIYRGDRARVADDVYVLGGLTFGWAITTAYWPAQPTAQSCSLALNVPDFVDVYDLAQGDEVYVKVSPYAAELSVGVDPIEIDGPVVAEFYGRITDLTAVPRGGRLGVTLSVTAVDYTADLNEGLNTKLKSLRPWLYEFFVIQEPALANILWTYLGGTADTIDDLWTSETRYVNIARIPDAVGAAIDALLLSAFVYDPPDDSHRMLVSPRVDADGALIDPAVGRMFTLDTITVPAPDAAPNFTLSAKWIEKGVQWVQDKNKRPGIGLVNVLLGVTEGETIEATTETVLVAGSPAVTLDNIEADDFIGTPPRTDQMVMFYLGDPANDDRWQLESLVLHPELVLDETGAVDDDALHQLGVDLYGIFPHWSLTEGTAARASGYTKRVSVEDIYPSVFPYVGDVVLSTNGIVTGATVKISGRTLTFDLALRRMRHVSISG